MQRQPVLSSAIKSAGYDPAAETLEIEFRSGRVYRYREVPQAVYSFFSRSTSKGGYLSRVIDKRYVSEDVTPAPDGESLTATLQASLARPRPGSNAPSTP